MHGNDIIAGLQVKGITLIETVDCNPYELEIRVPRENFKAACLFVHTYLRSPVMALFALDLRRDNGTFEIRCVFLAKEISRWCTVVVSVAGNNPAIDSIAKEIYSATLFEREMKEMFGILPQGDPDLRTLRLHEEVCPEGAFPLRKDFAGIAAQKVPVCGYHFNRVEGEGVFEVPVGPVHAGIIGPGHFRFSVAGEPIVNLELRLGFTHRGIEKLFEGKSAQECLHLSECVAGDSVIAHGWAFCRAVETIQGVQIGADAFRVRAICLELERIYNHLSGVSGIALDVGFSFCAQYAALLKERVLQVNKKLSGHRYLKGVLRIGGVQRDFDQVVLRCVMDEISLIKEDLDKLQTMLYGSVSFMDRIDETGVLRKKTAEDFGVIGLAGRASGVSLDLRRVFSDGYAAAGFRRVKYEKGDVLARVRMRIDEVYESMRLIEVFAKQLAPFPQNKGSAVRKDYAIGAVEGWRGPTFYWVKLVDGTVDRCKIVDASFHNWQGLSVAVLGNIVPDFPVSNKSFDLSYAGNDL
ncbi:MAG TPA: NADH-quinone oxidoreductase subunit C [Candidatus Omnitrophota bacterium]|nr:NADH-quinone oxidoreductase subunit C [Candidatus Omnitrophota bacterium]